MIDFNKEIKTNLNLPILYGSKKNNCSFYFNSLKKIIYLNKSNEEPEVLIFKDPIFKYENINYYKNYRNQFFPKIFLYNKNYYKKNIFLENKNKKEKNKIHFNLRGNFAMVQNWFMGHYGHNFHDNMPIFEFFRNYFSNNIKFILSEYEKDTHKITIDQLCLFDSFYKDNIVFLPPNTKLKIKGSLALADIASDDRHLAFNCLKYLKYLNKRKIFTISKNTQHHVVFCPREESSSRTGRCFSTKFEKNLVEVLSKKCQKNNIKFSIFKHKKFMKIIDQKKFFESATIVIGTHGTALNNVFWSKNIFNKLSYPVQIIEFVGNTNKENLNVNFFQNNNDLGHFYHYGVQPFNTQFHHLFYEPDGPDFRYVKIDLRLLESIIDNIFNNKN